MELNEKTYETYFLSYIDNELSAIERRAVESFVQLNPKYEAALQDLQKSVLVAEPIEFEDKFLLYRLDEMEATLDIDFKKSLYKKNVAPIRSLWNRNMLRYSAVAAAFILTIGTAIKYTSNKNQPTIISAHNSITKTKILVRNISDGLVSTSQPFITNRTNKVLVTNTYSNDQVIRKPIKKAFETIAIVVEPTSIASNSNVMLSNNNTLAAVAITEAVASIEKEQINKETEHSQIVQNPYQAESFEEINTNEPDRVIYISSIEIDSDKIRGFTRRINALFKRNKSDKQ